jgi:AraC family ethanolamine operon transcriptional activator
MASQSKAMAPIEPKPSIEQRTPAFQKDAEPADLPQGENVWSSRVDLVQVEPGRFSAEVRQVHIDGAALSFTNYNRRVFRAWRPPPGMWTVALRLPAGHLQWHGFHLGPEDLLIAAPQSGLDWITEAGAVVGVSFRHADFLVAATSFGLELSEDASEIFVVRASELKSIKHRRSDIDLSLSALAVERPDQGGRQAERDLLLSRVISLLATGTRFQPAGRDVQRNLAFSKAIAAISERPARVPDLADLCRIAGVAERTLRMLFQERCGLSPARFVRIYRLNGARADLVNAASPNAKIADVANKWGFWHLGQFARDYRQWFSELPSETCRHRSHAGDR